jgi:hypothetical protein
MIIPYRRSIPTNNLSSYVSRRHAGAFNGRGKNTSAECNSAGICQPQSHRHRLGRRRHPDDKVFGNMTPRLGCCRFRARVDNRDPLTCVSALVITPSPHSIPSILSNRAVGHELAGSRCFFEALRNVESVAVVLGGLGISLRSSNTRSPQPELDQQVHHGGQQDAGQHQESAVQRGQPRPLPAQPWPHPAAPSSTRHPTPGDGR